MAITPGDGGGVADICWISPSDQAGQVGNILTRLSNLEIVVAKLAGLNITATNASDLSTQLGVMAGGIIVSGEGGAAIPTAPGSFTGIMIGGGIMKIFENGTIQFEVDKTGIVTGGGGGIGDIITLKNLNDTLTFNQPNMNSVVLQKGTIWDSSLYENGMIKIPSSGYFMATASFHAVLEAGPGQRYLRLACYDGAIDDYVWKCLDTYRLVETDPVLYGFQLTAIFKLTTAHAENLIEVTLGSVDSLSSIVSNSYLSVVKLADL
jgi:hypothetical protein